MCTAVRRILASGCNKSSVFVHYHFVVFEAFEQFKSRQLVADGRKGSTIMFNTISFLTRRTSGEPDTSIES